jgi:dTDP-4-amino-4,6-dideoxygalactose transaminase
MRVPFIDLRRINARFAIVDAMNGVLDSGRYLFGPEVDSFEREFAAFIGVAHCVGVASGLDALRLTLRAWMTLGALAPGDEVLVPANSFVASALAVTECGLTLRLMDVDPQTFNVTVEIAAASRTERTRALMLVHLYGQIADIENIETMCREENLLLIEDAAQAHGARALARRAGSFGNAAGFSFYPTKNLGALGDAGCVVTNDAALAKRVRAIANYGSIQKYRHQFEGINSRMDELQAAVLRLKLRQLDQDNSRRREVAMRYRAGIRHPLIGVPAMPADPDAHVWHIFAITCSYRENLVRHLEKNGVETIVHYPCAIHQQPAYRSLSGDVHMPVSERLSQQVLSLPMSPVMENSQVDHVIDALNSWPEPFRPDLTRQR